IVLAWVGALLGLFLLSRVAGGAFSSSFAIPGTVSQQAADLLKHRFPQQAGDSATLVFQSRRGLTDPTVQAAVRTTLSAAARLKGVVAVGSPYQPTAAGGLA